MITFDISSGSNYFESAKTIFEQIKNNDKLVLFVNGSMGVGKTTFSRSLIKMYGGTNVNSASYGIVSKISCDFCILHCDFYRYEPNDLFFETEIQPLLSDKYLLLLEWASPQITFSNALHYHLEIILLDNGTRNLKFSKFN